MEKAQIAEMLTPYALSAESAKSATNRISSALEKTGTPAQLLSSVTQSMGALAERTDENSSDYGAIRALVSAFAFATAIAKKGSEKPKKKRENWHEADSPEGQAILAGLTAPAKPKKSEKAPEKSAGISSSNLEEIVRLMVEKLSAGR